MRQIDDFFFKSVDKTLYHYTGISSLLGMADKRKVWASHIYYLNDSKEILYACGVLQRLLSERISNHRNEERIFLEQFKDWLISFNTAFHIFIFSLSERNSLLSQWRGYTPHGKGVSIGFSTDVINHIVNRADYKIAKCLYKNAEHQELMCSLLEKMLTTFNQRLATINISKNHPTQKYHGFLEEFRGTLLQILAVIKDPAFEEEQEWRIISQYFPNFTVSEIKFREGASMLMPYIQMELPEQGLLFEKVILGPSDHPNLSMQALSTFLSNHRICNETVNSNIPFRKWS
jgi:Protein of unknown function (DUF2971)